LSGSRARDDSTFLFAFAALGPLNCTLSSNLGWIRSPAHQRRAISVDKQAAGSERLQLRSGEHGTVTVSSFEEGVVVIPYFPKTIETSSIELSPDLRELVERLAENNHDHWAQNACAKVGAMVRSVATPRRHIQISCHTVNSPSRKRNMTERLWSRPSRR
jgi:hypothetical protein